MINLIQSLPSPSAYSGNYSHIDGESWMVDGEALVMTMKMISSKSPSRQDARTEFLIRVFGFSMAAECRCVSWKIVGGSNVFRSGGLSSPKGERRGPLEVATPGLGAAHLWPCRGVVWPLGAPPLLRLLNLWVFYENRQFGIFREFSEKFDMLHKNKTPGQLCRKQR